MHEKPVKLMVLGTPGVGKTAFINKYAIKKDEWREDRRALYVDDKQTVKMLLYEYKKELGTKASYFRGLDGFIILYDVTNEYSFSEAKKWAQKLSEGESKPKFVLVATNADNQLERVVPRYKGEACAEYYKIPFYETKANTRNHNLFKHFTQGQSPCV